MHKATLLVLCALFPASAFAATTGTVVLESDRGPALFFDFSNQTLNEPDTWNAEDGDIGLHFGEGEPYFLIPFLTAETGGGILELGQEPISAFDSVPTEGYQRTPTKAIIGHSYAIKTADNRYAKFQLLRLVNKDSVLDEVWEATIAYSYENNGSALISENPNLDEAPQRHGAEAIADTPSTSYIEPESPDEPEEEITFIQPELSYNEEEAIAKTEERITEKRQEVFNQLRSGETATPPTRRTTDSQARPFWDITETSDYYLPVKVLYLLGIIDGYPDKSFRPENPISREEALKLVLGSLEITPRAGEITSSVFMDIPMDRWSAPYILYGHKAGIINGYPDDTFKPANTVTRAEFLSMLTKSYPVPLENYPRISPFDDVPENTWYSNLMQFAKDTYLIIDTKSNNGKPHQPLTRGEAAKILYRFLNLKLKDTSIN